MQNTTQRRFELVAEFVAALDENILLCNRVAFFDFREKVITSRESKLRRAGAVTF